MVLNRTAEDSDERKETDMQTSRVKRNATVLRSTMVSVVVLAYRFIWNATSIYYYVQYQ